VLEAFEEEPEAKEAAKAAAEAAVTEEANKAAF